MNSKSKIKNYFVAALAILALSPLLTFAAEIRVDGKNQVVKAGEQFIATIFLNTEESVNALEGQILFPADLLEFVETQDGNSIVNFWIEQPKIEADKIFFSGIIPGGFRGENGLIFSVLFRAKKSGDGSIAIEDVKILKNDGAGTAVETQVSGLHFLISYEAPETQLAKIKDIDPPESFVPEVASDPALFNDKWFLVFTTQDKGLGIDHYEIREGFWGEFRVAQSPYLLQNQNLDKKIFVKAVDKNGNARIEVFRPPKLRTWYENYSILIILAVGIALLYFIRRISWKRNAK